MFSPDQLSFIQSRMDQGVQTLSNNIDIGIQTMSNNIDVGVQTISKTNLKIDISPVDLSPIVTKKWN
jgi:hypothetical protein